MSYSEWILILIAGGLIGAGIALSIKDLFRKRCPLTPAQLLAKAQSLEDGIANDVHLSSGDIEKRRWHVTEFRRLANNRLLERIPQDKKGGLGVVE